MRYRLDSTALWPLACVVSLLGPNAQFDALRDDEPWYSAMNATSQDYFARLHTLLEGSAMAALQRMFGLCAMHGSESIDAALFRRGETEIRFTVFSALGETAPMAGENRVPISWITESQTTEAVTGRVAAFVALGSNATSGEELPERFAATVKEMKRLYGVRSAYVHRGSEVEPEDLASLRQLVAGLTPTVLRWNDRAGPEDEQAHVNWLRLVDYAIATLEMGRVVLASDLVAMGVLDGMPSREELRLSHTTEDEG